MNESKQPYDERQKAQEKSVMLYVGESKTAFRCEECGANVFTKISDGSYRCNGCGTEYSAS